MRAIARHKHVVMMNAELDGTLGPILKTYADKAGVVITNTEGDQPGVIMNLYRWIKGLGVRPVLCGNIKGLHDPYRNPTTQEGSPGNGDKGAHGDVLRGWHQGFLRERDRRQRDRHAGGQARHARAGRRNRHADPGSGQLVSAARAHQGPGIVDYCVGAMPNPGIFVLGTTDDAFEKHYLSLYKMGQGPLYCFYWPYHLCHFEVPFTVARAAIFRDPAITPWARPAST